VGLDAGSVADDDAALDLHEGADKAIVSDMATVKVYWFDNCHSFSEMDVIDAYLTKG
jgi:hypothetical protein